ncbi:MAG TPA: hypothetical protein VJ827_05940 [Rubrobacter sp.]|nr:hypothetical protein [Rubrobacter sp.]
MDDQPLILEGSGYADYREFEDLMRALEKISRDVEGLREATIQAPEGSRLHDKDPR